MRNDQRVAVNVSTKNDNIPIKVFCKNGDFATTIEALGPNTVAVGKLAKFYYTNICNKSLIRVSNFFYTIKVRQMALVPAPSILESSQLV